MPKSSERPVALLFPGQGAQYARMAAGLYGHSDVFTGVMDDAFRLLGAQGESIRSDWLHSDSPETVDDVTRAQPLLYAVDYALGRLVMSWGIEPAAMLGHSVGEMAAATLAGVFDFEAGMGLMRDRMALFADTPAGGMLAVAASAAELVPYISDEVAVAAVNARQQTLLAGLQEPLEDAERRMRADGFVCKAVRARQAFHSPAVRAAAASSVAGWQAVALAVPRRTVYSSYLGGVLSAEAAQDPVFWARQPIETVLFGPTLDRLLGDGDYLLVEAGPGQGLSALARRHPAVTSGHSDVVGMLPAKPGGADDDRRAVRAASRRITAEGRAVVGV
jgi:[acyl-carrier-protein] S-malonyltransferase